MKSIASDNSNSSDTHVETMVGSPLACASTPTIGNPSKRDGNTKTSITCI